MSMTRAGTPDDHGRRVNEGTRMQLVCPAGNLPALQAAVDAGADAVYAGFRDETNARAFPGLNFDHATLREGTAYAHHRGANAYLALTPYPDGPPLPPSLAALHRAAAVRRAAQHGSRGR